MRVLFACPPLYGHYHPLVPYARALQDAGHDVAFAAPVQFRSIVESSGFRCFTAGYYPSGFEIIRKSAGEPKDNSTPSPAWSAFSRIFIEGPAPAMARDIIALFERWRPDVIVRDTNEFGSFVAAELLAIPHARAGAGWPKSPDWWVTITLTALTQLFQSFDASTEGLIDRLFRYLNLTAIPPSLRRNQDYLRPIDHFIRPSLFDNVHRDSLPNWLQRFRDGPTIYATLGTSTQWNRMPGALYAIIHGLGGEPYNVVLTVGEEELPDEIHSVPPNVHIERYVPQSLLLPLCSAVVSHGGFSSTIGPLMHGLPLVVMPMGADQFDNADRAQRAAAAVIVGPDERTPDRVRQAMRTVLEDPRYRAGAERVCDDIAAMPGLEHAVELLERLAVERQPIRREAATTGGV